MILSAKCVIDTMKNKKMSTDKYVVIVLEDGYAIKNTVQDKLLTLYSNRLDAEEDLRAIEKLFEKNSWQVFLVVI